MHSTDPEERREWWVLFRLAIPIIFTNLTMFSMSAVDTLMIGHRSKEDLAAMGLALVWLQGTTMFASGILFGMDPIVSQAHGAGDRKRIAAVLGQGWVLAAILTPLLMLAWWWTEDFLLLAGQDPALAHAGGAYARWLCPSAPFLMIFTVSRQWLQGRRIVKPILFHAMWANALNVLLNWVLIFGHAGAPEMGLVGASVATSITRAAMAAGLVAYLMRKQHHVVPRLGLVPAARDGAALRQLFWLGLPVAFQVSFEIGAFGLSTLFAGRLGTTAASAHLVVLNMASITFMVPLGIGLAASARVGNLIGEGRLERARRSARWAFGMGAGTMACFALVFYFGRHELPWLYTNAGEIDVRMAAASILPIAAAFQIFDGIQVVGSGVLRGAGQTRASAFFNFLGYWPLALPLGWFLTFRMDMGIRGIWWGLALGLAGVATGLIVWWKRTPLERIDAPA
ncbi:MAG: MATE family efflux transporter [Planctomycetes bacterium]|nr:MATE family efflux transporter [Planctomycetota bacterium]MCB9910244.1 MATE family efflux transporter [Planctomycetota bacterium]HRV82512.1 MATE family efflux transporter [Planctomycetota bacterium]